MKIKLMALLLASAMIMSLSSCSGKKDASAQNPYYPDNEIITRENLDDGRMVIVVDTQYNVSAANIEEVIESRFPDVNVILRLQNTPDAAYQTKKSLEHGHIGDIFFCAMGLDRDAELLEKHFIDLSNAPFINNYYQNALDGVATNGKIYMLPGFADIYGIVYDKTLFKENGWSVPKSRDEFIALCSTIENKMGYPAFVPTLRFPRMAMLISHAFGYEKVIAGADNQKWLQAYRAGNESFSNHMEPLFESMKELYDKGTLPKKSLNIEAGVRSTMLYSEHSSAMTMETQAAPTYAKTVNSDHEFGMMPFWNSNEPDSDFVVSSPSFNICANKALESPENAEKLKKVMEILEYLSTPDGQKALMSKESNTISNVKGVDSMSGGDFMSDVADTINKGNIFQEVRYTNLAYNNVFQTAFREALIGYITGTMDINEAMTHCDKGMIAVKTAVEPKESVYGTVSENFTVLETSAFVADILRENSNADIALVLGKWQAYGETGCFYKGDITDAMLNYVSLDYVTGRDQAYNKLVTVNLTGKQILHIMNYPYLNNSSTNTSNISAKTTSPDQWSRGNNPCYWVPSGLKLEYAPLLTENNVLQLSNMDGSAFDLEKTYKVAVWNGSFSNLTVTDYFDEETLKAMSDVTPISDAGSIELIKAKLKAVGQISPPKDGRFNIRWDIKPDAVPKQ